MNTCWTRLSSRVGTSSLTAALVVGFASPSHAILDFLKRDNVKPTAAESASNDGAAAQLMALAQSREGAGDYGKALNIYEDIVKDYPRSQSASESQFKIGELLQMEGKDKKSFEAYQKLLTDYKGSPRFVEAIQRQFNIAENLRINGDKGILGGIGADIQPSKLIEFYEQISSNAPRTEISAKSVLAVGEIQAGQGDLPAAIMAFESVVESYPKTNYAAEAQYNLVKLHGREADKSFSPVDLRQQREAGEDFLNQFGSDDSRAQEVRQQLGALSDKESEKAYEVGRFYEKSGDTKAAVIYYREVARHPNTKNYDEARQRMAKLVERDPSLASLAKVERTRVSTDTGGNSPILNPAPQAFPTDSPSPSAAAPPSADAPSSAGPPPAESPEPEEKSRPWNILKKPKMRTSEDDVLPIPTADPIPGT